MADRFEHSCERSDEDEAIIRNLCWFGRFAVPERLPPYPPARARLLARLQRQYGWRTAALEKAAAAADRNPELADPVALWPRDQIRDRIPTPRAPRPEESKFRGRA